MTSILTEERLTEIASDLAKEAIESVFEFVDGKYITESTDPADLEELDRLNELVE